MSNEMSECVKSFGWKFTDLQRVTVNALKSSFIPFEERLEIIEKVVKPAYAAISAEQLNTDRVPNSFMLHEAQNSLWMITWRKSRDTF